MRIKAHNSGVPVPHFIDLFHDADIEKIRCNNSATHGLLNRECKHQRPELKKFILTNNYGVNYKRGWGAA